VRNRLLSEFVGVFGIVALGYGSIAAAASGLWLPGPYGVSAVFGVVVALGIQALGRYSIQFNPGVTVALGLLRWHPWREVWPFVGVQYAGALAAMGFVHAAFPAVNRFGAPGAPQGWMAAIAGEVVVMAPFMFLCMVSGTCFPKWRAVAIGGMVFAISALSGRFAGGLSMNPACTLATNLMEGNLAVLPVYAVGTTVGCFVGFWSFERLRPVLDRSRTAPWRLSRRGAKA